MAGSRILDAACVVIVDQRAGDVWSPTQALSIEGFQAALIGRHLLVSTLGRPRCPVTRSAKRTNHLSAN